MNKKIVKHPYGGLKTWVRRISWLDLVVIAIACVAIIVGMTKYTPSVEKLKQTMIKDINNMKTENYMEDDREAVDALKKEYQGKVDKLYLKSDVYATVESFGKAVAEVKTKDVYIDEYYDQLMVLAKNVYDKEERQQAKAMARGFRKNAKEDTNKENLEARFKTVSDQILEFKTKDQHKHEQEIKAAVTGRWQVRDSQEYPFKLDEDSHFIMPIDIGEEHGYLTGSWRVDGNTITVDIMKNTLSEDYKPYAWQFTYDEANQTLIGQSAGFTGWVYTRY